MIEKINRVEEQIKKIKSIVNSDFTQTTENTVLDIICSKNLEVTCSAEGNYPYRTEFRDRHRNLIAVAFNSNSYIKNELLK